MKKEKELRIDILIEEMAELTQALIKYKRYGDDPKVVENIKEEVADVYICLHCLEEKLDLDFNEIKTFINLKIERTMKRKEQGILR